MIDDAAIKLRYGALDPVLDERGRRRFAAAEALAAGRGGVVAVARITGIARSTIGRGLAELRGEAEPEAAPGRVFSFITQNWRGKPLVSLQTIVQLIAATTTNTSLKVRCAIDRKTYPAGVKVTDREMDAINILRHSFHGDWNYTSAQKPRSRSDNS